jgi:Putative beta barrel porin-7 (BBP7)
VINSTRLIGLILTAAIWARGAAAQELPPPRVNDSWSGPGLTVPPLDQDGLAETYPEATLERSESPIFAGPHEIAPESLDGYEQFHGPGYPGQGYDAHGYAGHGPDHHEIWDGTSAPIESTGTWLRRGFWYAEAEAVIWNRVWNRDDKIFAAQDSQVQNPFFFVPLPGQPTAVLNTNRLMLLSGSDPGEDTSVRVTLGHFLFRDSRNRDHTAEFTAFGGGDWEQNRRISSSNNFGLFVPFYIDANNRSFDQSTTQEVDYSSRYASFEGNYRVKWRLRRDQLVMDPNGQWHRTANSGWTHDYLVGLRFMELREILDWRAEDIAVLGNDGTYFLRTDNDMFGFQLGAGFQYETSRWSLGLFSKGGVFVNDALGRATLDFSADDDDDADLRLTDDELSFIGEAKLLGRWHVAPNCSLRASYEMMLLTSQALAPHQATFITDTSYLSTSGDPFYHGASFGFECYW